MSCFRILAIALLLALSVAVNTNTALCDEIPFRNPNWSIPDGVIDVAISADGSIVALATYEEGLKDTVGMAFCSGAGARQISQ